MIGSEIHQFAKKIWPLNRSLTGEGVRKTLIQISKHLPNIKIKSFKTGTAVFDWIIPKEWKVNKAYILTPNGNKICDYSKNNLHLVGYSKAFKGTMTLKKLKRNLHSLPKQSKAIPYVTSYYEERWGFCISQEQLKKLKDGNYKVVVDTELVDGSLNYGEIFIKGRKSIIYS